VRVDLPRNFPGVEPWMIILTGRTTSTNENVYSWIFQGSNDGASWTNIYQNVSFTLSPIAATFLINANGLTYTIFRLFCANATGTNPGLSCFQVYNYI
jgi:hypothetical protein